ncbi:MAG: hypothetical protein IKD72_00970 [Clostridia bacterium]|nr:hypothetical protein [Clostridia bacterium]
MKTLKKSLALLLCLLLTAGMLTLGGYAADAPEDGAQLPDCLTWAVTFDKPSYGLFDTANVTVTVTNASELALTDLTLAASSFDYSPYAVFYHQRVLASGASCAFSYACRLSPQAAGLPFFARVLLFLRDLFFGPVRGNAAIADLPSVASAQADFGRYGQHEIRLTGSYDTMNGDPETIAQAVAQYNAALENGKAQPCTMQATYVDGSLKADGAVSAILKRLEPMLRRSLENNSVTVDSLPGSGPLLQEDVLAVSVREGAETTVLELLLADQRDGIDADPVNGGAVARGCGPLFSMRSVLNELGATVTAGEETIEAVFTQPVIRVTLDNATGNILEGSWHYRTTLRIGSAETALGDGPSVPLNHIEVAYDTDFTFPCPPAA